MIIAETRPTSKGNRVFDNFVLFINQSNAYYSLGNLSIFEIIVFKIISHRSDFLNDYIEREDD